MNCANAMYFRLNYRYDFINQKSFSEEKKASLQEPNSYRLILKVISSLLHHLMASGAADNDMFFFKP